MGRQHAAVHAISHQNGHTTLNLEGPPMIGQISITSCSSCQSSIIWIKISGYDAYEWKGGTL